MVKETHPGLSVFAVGNSLGATIIARAGQLADPAFLDGVVLLAPVLSTGKVARQQPNGILCGAPSHRAKMAAVGLISLVKPQLPMIAKAPNPKFPLVPQLKKLDPLCYSGKVRIGTARKIVALHTAVMQSALTWQTPVLVFHCEADTVGGGDCHEQFIERASSCTDKTLRVLGVDSGMCHHLTQEPGNGRVLDEVLQWVEQRRHKPAEELMALYGTPGFEGTLRQALSRRDTRTQQLEGTVSLLSRLPGGRALMRARSYMREAVSMTHWVVLSE